MNEQSWSAVDKYFNEMLVDSDELLREALAANAAAGLPAIDVAPNQGKLLYLLARMVNARKILEVGTLGGYSTIWLARGLAEGGRVTSLEMEPHHAEIARSNLERAGLSEQVEILVGPALESLSELTDQAPFDLIFVDADKQNNPNYLDWALRLSRPGTVVVFDNVVRSGNVLDATSDDPSVVGTRELIAHMGDQPRLTATAIQTVGLKGWDGFAIAIVDDPR